MLNHNGRTLCEACFCEIESYPCPKCGHTGLTAEESAFSLPLGIVLDKRYRVGKMIKRGGFGITYMCLDLESGGRVALKEYYPGQLAARSSDRITLVGVSGENHVFNEGCAKFYTEAETLSRFRGNPRIVSVYEFFYANNTAYYVMEYLDGSDLSGYMKKKSGKLMSEEAIRIIREAAHALEPVHAAGFFHGDINPNNIFVCVDGRVKLIDFGAARLYVAEKSQSMDAVVMEGYAAPEQYSRNGNFGPHTDIYALGATLYYAMSGRVPEASVDRLAGSVMGYPGEVTQYAKTYRIIRKCMELKPQRRFQRAEDLRRALETVGTESAPVWNRKLFVAVLAALLIVAGGVTAGVILSRPDPIAAEFVDFPQLVLRVGDSHRLLTDHGEGEVKWSSSPGGVVEVDRFGNVTAVGEGYAIVSARAGGYVDTCEVRVDNGAVAAEAIRMDASHVVLSKDNSVRLAPVFVPSDTSNQTVLWSSSDEDVVSVSENGVLTWHRAAETDVIVRARAQSGAEAVCIVYAAGVTSIVLPEGETALTLEEGDSHSFNRADIRLSGAHTGELDDDMKALRLESEDAAVASVDGFTVKANQKGSTTLIFTTASGGEARCTVEVTEKIIPVEAIKAEPEVLTVFVGETKKVTATVSPDNATDRRVTWTSGDPEVATVSADGTVTGRKAGTAILEASAGEKTARCTVTVKAVPVEEIRLNREALVLEVGESGTLTAEASPDNAADKTVVWESLDTDVVTVSDSGVVTAMGAGTAAVRATAGGKSAVCTVTVKQHETEAPETSAPETEAPETEAPETEPAVIEVERITLNKMVVSLEKGESTLLTPRVVPENAADKTVTWSTSNANVVTVTDGRITAVGEGVALITATAGRVKAVCEVTVWAAETEAPETEAPETEPAVIEVTDIKLNKTSISLEKGNTETLTAAVMPDNASDKTVTWSSSNTNVATVWNGTVTAVGKGTASITATAGDKTVTCTVTVTEPVPETEAPKQEVTKVTVMPSAGYEFTKIGAQYSLNVTVEPGNAADKTITWSSSDTNVVTVDNKGTIKAVGAGEAAVTAEAANGVSASIKVTVKVDTLKEGTCNKKKTAKWSLDTQSGILTVSGSGDIDNYSGSSPAPWHAYREQITAVVIENGIGGIGDYAFSDCSRMTSISVPDSVSYMGKYAFRGCSALTSFAIPSGVTTLYRNLFAGCTSIGSIYVPTSVQTLEADVFSGWQSYQTINFGRKEYVFGVDDWGAASKWDAKWNNGCSAVVNWNISY